MARESRKAVADCGKQVEIACLRRTAEAWWPNDEVASGFATGAANGCLVRDRLAGVPSELKHISRRRNRKQKRLP